MSVVKTEYAGYVKDDTPGQCRAVLNTDNASYKAYRESRTKNVALAQVIRDVDNIKHDMSEIKTMLLHLINGKQ